MRKESLAIIAIIAASVLHPDTAEAHGRLPEVTRISFALDGTLLARASFGLLVSRDHGAAWDLVCGTAIGFGMNEDPVYAASPDGAILATTAQGLAVSRDGACTWSNAAALPFLDVTSDGALALSSRYSTSDGTAVRYESRLWRGTSPVGAPLDPSVVPSSFAVSGARVDVAALRFAAGAKSALLLSSPDEGATWSETPIALEPGEDGIAAVARDDGHVYLRTAGRLLALGAEGVRTVYRAPYGLTGVAFSADRSEVWVAGGRAGIEHAKTADFVFERRAALDARCLAVDARGLWACADDRTGAFSIGLSTDGGRSFAPRLRMCGIRGSVQCSDCAGEWAKERHELGCDAVAPASMPSSEIAPPSPAPPPAEVAGCALSPARPSRSFVALAIAVLLGLIARMRRVP